MPTDSGSDTEYETDNDSRSPNPPERKHAGVDVHCLATNSPPPSGTAQHSDSILDALRRHALNMNITKEDVRLAIKALERVSREGIVDDDTEAHTFNSAAVLAHVLESGVDNLSFWEVRHTLLNAEVVDMLFKLRAQCRPPNHEGHIVTFSDALLMLLLPSVPVQSYSSTAGWPEWEHMQEQDLLFAATCLPEKIHALPGCVRDGAASPATRRLALSLLWGCHVFWSGWKPAEDLEGAVEEYVNCACSEESLTSRNCLAYSYVLALFAEVSDPTAFRPSTHCKLLCMLSFMLEQSSSQEHESSVKVDALGVLVCHGSFVQWSWQAWTCDGQNETILCGITALWLHKNHDLHYCAMDWATAFMQHEQSAIPVFRLILKRATPSATALLLALLSALVHTHPQMHNQSIKEDVFLSASKLLVMECQDEVKELVVCLWSSELATQTLSLLETSAMMKLISDSADLLSECFSELPEEGEQTPPKFNILLEFLCIVAQSETISKLLMSHTTLVPRLSEWACSFEGAATPIEHCRASVVLLFGLLVRSFSRKKILPYDAEAVHDIILDRGPYHVIGAAAFAQYNMWLLNRKSTTQLMRLEVWDYFVDTLHLSPEDPAVFPYRELLEVSFCIFCAVLDTALQALEPGPLQFVLSSERTLSMADRLKAFKIADVEDVSLASLNESAANFLLQKMKGALSGSSLDQPFPMNFKLTYAEVNRAMRIISVPCLSS